MTTQDLSIGRNQINGKADSLSSILNIQDTLSLGLNRYQQKIRTLKDSAKRKITFDDKINDEQTAIHQKTDSLFQRINRPIQGAQEKIYQKLEDVMQGTAPQIPGAEKN